MHPRLVSRRLLLGSSAAALASGAAFAQSLGPQDPSAKLDNAQSPAAVRASLARTGRARRMPMPALQRNDLNPHFRPLGPALSAAEQTTFKPGPVSGRGL